MKRPAIMDGAEIARLRRIEEAARGVVNDHGFVNCGENCVYVVLRAALADQPTENLSPENYGPVERRDFNP